MSKQKMKIALYWMILGIALTVIPLFSIVTKADSNGAVITIDATSKDIAAIKDTIQKINTDLVTSKIGPIGRTIQVNGKAQLDTETSEGIHVDTVSTTVVNISINNKVYSELNMQEKEAFMRIALSDVQNSSISVINRNKIYNFIADSDARISGLVRQLSEDVRVDMPAAYEWFRPFSSPLGVFLGVVTIAIFTLLGISIVLDIAFLTIPGIQWFLIKPCSDNDKPRLVSLEAWESYKQATQTHEQVLWLFFRKKSGQMVVLGICILYLVSGNLFALVAKMVDYLQGTIEVVFGS